MLTQPETQNASSPNAKRIEKSAAENAQNIDDEAENPREGTLSSNQNTPLKRQALFLARDDHSPGNIPPLGRQRRMPTLGPAISNKPGPLMEAESELRHPQEGLVSQVDILSIDGSPSWLTDAIITPIMPMLVASRPNWRTVHPTYLDQPKNIITTEPSAQNYRHSRNGGAVRGLGNPTKGYRIPTSHIK